MSDILIRGVEIPKGDLEYVSLLVYGDGRVFMRKAGEGCSQRLQDLAAPLPAGHGRLIDAKKLMEKGIWLSWSVQKWVSEVDIMTAPTIVPAEGRTDDVRCL